MELVVNLSMLGAKPTGLGVYSEHCARGIAERFNVKLIAGAGKLPPGEVILQAPESVAIGGGKLAAIRRQLWMRSLTIDENQLMYSPTHHGLPNINGQIITIHDLICLRFPSQHIPQYLFFRFGLPRLLKKCRAVFTVSETTKQDVASQYAYPLEKIYVVPNGVDASAFSPDPTAKPKEPFLLMVGARYSHKNVDEVLDHAHLWSDRFKLIVTSCGGDYKARLLQKVAELGIGDRVEFSDYLSRDQLIKLYQGCSALLYPSKWEGFGIPPLEALACGSPVIASDIPVHREVLGNAAFFVQLGNASSWAEALEAVQSEKEVTDKLNNSREILQRFTWDNAVDALERSLLKVEPRLAESKRDNVNSV
jgi:glycosyltransferase involved in cell wall biosynthesis